MSALKRTVKFQEPQPGFTPLPAGSVELDRLLAQAIAAQARAEVSGIAEEMRILGESRNDCIEFLLPATAPVQAPSEAFAVIFLGRATLLCLQSSAIALENDRLRLKAPFRAFKLQRRSRARVDLTGAYEYLAEVSPSSGPGMTLKILDISAHGMSVLSSTSEARHLEKGTRIGRIAFRIDGKRITLDATVTYQSASNADVRIGMKFGKIATENSELISLLVARHLAQYS
jgi:hypothetical protein